MVSRVRSVLRAVLVAAAAIAALAFPGSAFGFGPLSSFGVFGDGVAGGIEQPRGVAVAADGTSYVADYDNYRVDVFAADGSFLRAFGKNVNPSGGNVCTAATGCQEGLDDESAGAIDRPWGVAIGPEGNVFVADRENNRIDVFSSEGAFLRAFGKEVNPSGGNVCTAVCQAGDGLAGAGDMSGPRGIAADASGAVYVADYGNQRIDVFSVDGAFIRAFGKGVNSGLGDPDVCTTACKAGVAGGAAGEMRLHFDVAVAPGDRVVVANSANNRIDVFSSGGTFIYGFGMGVKIGGGNLCTTASGCQEVAGGSGPGALSNPSAVRVGLEGNVYVAESQSDRVSEYTIDGAFIRAFGAGVIDGAGAFQICTFASGCQKGLETTIPGATPDPFGLAFDCRGALHVAEGAGGFARVERFGEPGTALPPCTSATPIAAPVTPSNKFKFGKLKLNRKKGTAMLFVKVPGAGKLVLKGKGIHKVKRVAKKAGNVKLPVKLVGKAKRKLLETGKATVRAKVTFTPTGGTARTKAKSLTLHREEGR
jgi:DNA-binding beta-propeller fold protein YncE